MPLMINRIKAPLYRLLRWSEQYTKADMVYLAHGNFWLLSGRFISVGSGVLLTIAFANLLAPETFGAYKYILAIAGFVGAFSLGGLGGALARAIVQGKRHVVAGVYRASLLWSLPASFLAALGSAYYFYNGNVPLGMGLLLIAAASPFLNSFGLYKSILLGEKDFRALSLTNIPRSVVPVGALIVALVVSQDLLVVLVTYFVSNLVMGWLVYRWTLRKYKIARARHAETKEVVTYGKHLSVMGTVSQMTDNLDQLLLWHFAGPVQVAMYAFALAPIREIRNFSENIYPLIFPKFATKTVEEMKTTAPLRILQLGAVLGVAGIGYVFLAPWLYSLVFPQYTGAVFASQILAMGLILQSKGIVETMLYVQGNTRLRYVTVFATQGVKVVLWFILIPMYGFMGAVAGIVAADITAALMSWRAYNRLV